MKDNLRVDNKWYNYDKINNFKVNMNQKRFLTVFRPPYTYYVLHQ